MSPETTTEKRVAEALLGLRKSHFRASQLAMEASQMLWASVPDLLRAEHALREALQIIETLKGESQ